MPFDPSKSKPVYSGGFNPAKSKPVYRPKGPDPYSMEGLTAGAETVANVASAGVGGLVGGLAYLGGLAADATQGRYDPRGAPMAAMQATQNALTYQPRGELGQEVSGNVNNVLSLPARGGAALGTNVARVTNSPALGAAANTGVNAAAMLLPTKLARGGARVLNRRGTRGADIAAEWRAGSPEEALLAQARIAQQERGTVQQLPAQQQALPAPQAAMGQQALPAPQAPAPRVTPTVKAVRRVRQAQNVARAVVEPLTQQGPQNAALRALIRYGVRPEDLEGLTSNPSATGARRTLPEQIADPEAAAGASRLLDTVQSEPTVARQVEARDIQNNAARLGQLDRMAAGQDAAASARAEVSGPLYRQAFEEAVTPAQMNRGQIAVMDSLLQRPAVADALGRAKVNLQNKYGDTVEPQTTIEGLHQAKVALDDMIDDKKRGAGGSVPYTVEGMEAARRHLLKFIEDISPTYRAARVEHARMSRPLNQAQIAKRLKYEATGSLENLGQDPRLQASSLNNIMDPMGQPGLIQKALGKPRANRLEDVMEPAQLQMLRTIAQEVSRRAAVEGAGAGKSSPTAQRLYSNNVLNSLGVTNPHPGVATAIEKALRSVQWITDGDAAFRAAIADMILNPGKAAEAFKQATPNRQNSRTAPPQKSPP
jgi:hypothetical protein